MEFTVCDVLSILDFTSASVLQLQVHFLYNVANGNSIPLHSGTLKVAAKLVRALK